MAGVEQKKIFKYLTDWLKLCGKYASLKARVVGNISPIFMKFVISIRWIMLKAYNIQFFRDINLSDDNFLKLCDIS